MAKTDRCIVRNTAYCKAGFGIRERHNERKNTGYAHTDIDPDRAALNVHFKKCDGTYTEILDRLERDGIISTSGLKPDAKVMEAGGKQYIVSAVLHADERNKALLRNLGAMCTTIICTLFMCQWWTRRSSDQNDVKTRRWIKTALPFVTRITGLF